MNNENFPGLVGISKHLFGFLFLLTVVPFVAVLFPPQQVRLQVGQAAAPPGGDGVHAPHDGPGVRRREGAGEERLLGQPALLALSS